MTAFLVALSDIALVLLIACFVAFAWDAKRARNRNGVAIRRFSEFALSLAIFFGWFALVYFDRRFNVWPWADLVKVMGYEWYWPLRLMLVVTLTRLWWAMRRGGQ